MAFNRFKEYLKPITEFKFSKLDSRSRIIVIIVSLVSIVFLMYLISNYFFGGGGAGSASVASAPSGLKTLPGAQVTPEYERVIREVEQKRTREAEATGTSSIGTISNVTQNSQQCTIICSDQSVNVKGTLDEWSRRGDIGDDVAADLQQLANKQVSVDEFAAKLNDLVRQGKLTPEQARELLAQYKKQHQNLQLQQSATLMDGLIKSGDLSLDAANELLSLNKDGASQAQYAAALNRLVSEGKISPAVAQQLLAQYTKQRTRQIIDQSIAFVRQLARDGKLVKEVEEAIIGLENQFVPLEQFGTAIQGFVDKGQLIPAVAQKLVDEYKMQKASVGPGEAIADLLAKAEASAYAELDDLEKKQQITKDVADQIRGLIKQDIPFADFEAFINQLAQQNKLTPEIAKLKIADYRAVKGLRDLSKTLNNAQANNATSSDYADLLRAAVQNGTITPEDAARLLREYQASLNAAAPATVGGGATPEFAQFQKELAQAQPAAEASVEQFTAVSAQGQEVSEQDRQALIQSMMNSMSGQAQQLIVGWQPPIMQVKAGISERERGGREGFNGRDGGFGPRGEPRPGVPPKEMAVLIKAGTILNAVLDTEVNSDYPDSPVMATIVDGPYKGAKLLGKLATTKSVSGQMDRIALNFTIMNTDEWPKSKSVSAFAIDPDTAKTVLATEVDYHYLQRFGAIMATSFVQGYADAIKTSGSTTSTSGFFTNTSNPKLSPQNKLAVGIGKIGETLGEVTQNYVNIPPTVKIASGVGLGILFMSDLT